MPARKDVARRSPELDRVFVRLIRFNLAQLIGIELAAALCNTSKRTLQRKLKKMGTHYNEVLGHARFRAASRMLQNAGMTVTDIGYRIGYSDVAHFARAFQRIAGVTPQVYRQQFNH